MGLYIDNLAKYKEFLVTVHCGYAESTIEPISGIILDENFGIPMTAQLDANIAGDVTSMAKGAAAKVAEKYVGNYASNVVANYFTSLIQTAQEWKGGSKFAFNLSFNVFKTGVNGTGTVKSYSDLHGNLAKFTQTKSNALDPIMNPYYYDPTKFKAAVVINDTKAVENQLFTVTIGSWFKARMLLPTEASMTLSTFTDLEGSPIFATVNMGFESYRVLNGEEWASILQR